MNVLFCWSGGKDSALALHEILRAGSHSVAALLTITGDMTGSTCTACGTALLERQARALNLPLEKMLITKNSSNEEYENRMADILMPYKSSGADAVVFEDIFLEDLRSLS